MKDKVVLVTGGSRGLGQELVKTFLDQGAIVGYTYYHSNEEDLLDNGAQRIRVDHQDLDLLSDAIKSFCRSNGKIDFLINNAGVGTPQLLVRKKISSILEELTVNFTSAVVATKATIPYLRRAENGLVINISSASAKTPQRGLSVYSSSKAALEVFTQSIAKEVSNFGISVVAFQLGPFESKLLELIGDEQINQIKSNSNTGEVMTAEQIAKKIGQLVAQIDLTQSGSTISITNGFS